MDLLDLSHHFWKSEVLLVNIGAGVLDLWLDMSSGPKWPKFSSYAQDPKVKSFFEILKFYWIHPMILEKMGSCLWKLEPEFLTNGLISPLPKALGPNCPKLVFMPQTPNARVLGSDLFWDFLMSSFIKFCFKQALIFKFWVIFDKVMSVYSQKIAKSPSKILFWCHFRYVSSLLSLI